MLKMSMSKNGKIMLAGLEGIALTKYKDSVGVWTIGIGATRSEIPDIAKWPINKAITIKEAFQLLEKSLGKYERAVHDTLNTVIEQYQFDALTSICYNIGTGGLSKSTFMKRINAHAALGKVAAGFVNLDDLYNNIENTMTISGVIQEEEEVLGFSSGDTIADAIMMWTKPKEITGRRRKEARLYTMGIYPSPKTATLFPVSTKGTPLYGKGKVINCEEYL